MIPLLPAQSGTVLAPIGMSLRAGSATGLVATQRPVRDALPAPLFLRSANCTLGIQALRSIVKQHSHKSPHTPASSGVFRGTCGLQVFEKFGSPHWTHFELWLHKKRSPLGLPGSFQTSGIRAKLAANRSWDPAEIILELRRERQFRADNRRRAFHRRVNSTSEGQAVTSSRIRRSLPTFRRSCYPRCE